MTVFQRFQLNDWRLELFTLVFTLLFVVSYKVGDLINQGKVNKFIAGVKGVFQENFYQFGVNSKNLFVKDSSENFSSYATGRENIQRAYLTFKLIPRHNIFLWVMESIFSFFTESVPAPQDRVDIVLFPSADYENFISAIVSKLGMNEYRKLNYFLSLTKTTDSALLPESFVLMSEANEFHEKTLTEKLASSLELSMASFLRFIAFTDQPNEKPESIRDLVPRRRVIISLNLPTGKQELEQLSNVLSAVFDVVDKLGDKDIVFRQEASKKIVRNRELEVKKIEKLQEEVELQKAADEKAKLKRQERENARKLSRDEQLKAEKKAQEKKQRKLQKKMKIRG